MGHEWLPSGEMLAGSWAVYIGEQKPTGAKVTGELCLTDLHLHFRAGLSLEKNAAAMISNRIKAFEKSEEHLAIPLGEIAGGEIVKKGFLLKSLAVKLKTGEILEFHFGAMSPQKALDALNTGLKKVGA